MIMANDTQTMISSSCLIVTIRLSVFVMEILTKFFVVKDVLVTSGGQ